MLYITVYFYCSTLLYYNVVQKLTNLNQLPHEKETYMEHFYLSNHNVPLIFNTLKQKISKHSYGPTRHT